MPKKDISYYIIGFSVMVIAIYFLATIPNDPSFMVKVTADSEASLSRALNLAPTTSQDLNK